MFSRFKLLNVNISRLIIASFLLVFLLGCTDRKTGRCSEGGFEHACHEPNFVEHFDFDLALPISTESLIVLLERNEIYYVYSKDNHQALLRYLEIAPEQVSAVLVILDKSGNHRNRVEKFLAIIDNNDEVIMISNEFGYLNR